MYLLEHFGQSENFGTFEGGTRHVRREENQHNQELTPDEVPIKVVAFVSKHSTFMGDGMTGASPIKAPWPPSTMASQISEDQITPKARARCTSSSEDDNREYN
jgi:hypothetical protein